MIPDTNELKYFVKKAGLVNAYGKERIDFFNRMSTNALSKLKPLTLIKTVFTTDKGRIIDLVSLIDTEERTLMIASHGYEQAIISHLDKYIIMDDVRLEADSMPTYIISLYGQDIIEQVNKSFSLELERNNIVHKTEYGYSFYDDFKTAQVNFIADGEAAEKIKGKLADFREMSADEYNYFRISKGIPEGKNELNEQINPAECGLTKYISYNKGCYIGQEVIARLDSQGKIPKQMVIVDSPEPLNNGEKIYTDDDKETGFISSNQTLESSNIGLGFIRSINLDYSKEYLIKRDNTEFKIKINQITTDASEN